MKFRFARHTNNLQNLKKFYVDILCFEVLGSFENHNNYDGIFIGKPNLDWHLEFTKTNEMVTFNFNEDDIFVFYPNSTIEYNTMINNLLNNNIKEVKAKNPYWNENGKSFLDPDGFHIIISNLKI